MLTTVLSVGERMHASRTELLAAIETGIVEANLHNPTGPTPGSGTSIGWRQETASSYPNVNRTDVAASARRFFQETRAALSHNPNLTPGALSQAVQGSAYPGRYAQHTTEAAQLLAQYGGAGGLAGLSGDVNAAPGGGAQIITPAVRADALRALLWVALVLGGAALIGLGAARAAGVRNPLGMAPQGAQGAG